VVIARSENAIHEPVEGGDALAAEPA